MKKILLILVAASLATLGVAQQRFDAVIMAGATFNQIDGDASGGYSHLGVRGGVGTSFSLESSTDSPWRMVIEVAYVEKGSVVDNNSFRRTATLRYVEVPIMLSLTLFDQRLRVAAGIAPAVLASARVEEDGLRVGAHERNYRPFDWLPLTATLRYRFADRWALEARYQNSLVSITTENNSGTYRLWRDNRGAFARSISLGLVFQML